MRFLFSIGLVLLLVATIFALQNPSPVTLSFVVWKFNTTLALAIIGAAIAGAVVVYAASLFSLSQLRGRVRAAETRLRQWEQERSTRSEPPESARP